MTSHQINSIETTQSHLGMKWYNFQKNFALIAGAVLNLIYSVGYLTGSVYFIETDGLITGEQVYEFYGHALQALDILFGLFMIGFAIFAFILRSKLARFHHNTLKFVYIFYSLYAGIPFLYSVISSAITRELPTAGTIVSAGGSLVFLFVNVKYFRKRAHLFINKNPGAVLIVQDNAVAPEAEAVAPEMVKNSPQTTDIICFCRKCGAKLMEESQFCSKCGTRIVKE